MAKTSPADDINTLSGMSDNTPANIPESKPDSMEARVTALEKQLSEMRGTHHTIAQHLERLLGKHNVDASQTTHA